VIRTLVLAAILLPLACSSALARPVPVDSVHEVAAGVVVPCRVGQHERRAARLAELPPGSWVRVDLYLGPEDVWNYRPTQDDCIAQASAHWRVLVTLLDVGDDALPDVPDAGRYVAGLSDLAARYRGQVDAWEVWNEPNHPLFGAGMTPSLYADLLTASYHAVKRADPSALVAAAGTSSVDLPFIEAVLRSGAPFDVMGAHPYEDPVDAAPGTTRVGFAALPELRALMLRYDRREPVWVTEYGWPSGGFLAEARAQLAEREYVEAAFVYDWSWL